MIYVTDYRFVFAPLGGAVGRGTALTSRRVAGPIPDGVTDIILPAALRTWG